MKRVVACFVVFVMLFTMFSFPVSAQETVSVYMDGVKMEFDVPPQIMDGRTMVPMRKIFEELGVSVAWEPETQVIIGTKANTTIVMQIASNIVFANDDVIPIDVPPVIVDGRTLIPLRAVAELFDVEVLWYADVATVSMYSNKNLLTYQKLYNAKGATIEVDANIAQEYEWYGWFDVPVAKLYADGGKTKIVPLKDVAAYRKSGWLPIHAYLLSTTFDEVQGHFGELSFMEYYAGEPDSGALSVNFYRNSESASVYLYRVAFWTNNQECVDITIRLKDAFPYLSAYADANGYLSYEDLKRAFCDSGIYGLTYRGNDEDAVYMNYAENGRINEYNCYLFDYDCVQMVIDCDIFGRININEAFCGFTTLT